MWHACRHGLVGRFLLASALLAPAGAARAQPPVAHAPARDVPAVDEERVPAEVRLDDERARAHFVAGESYFAAQRWADSAREFASAYEFSHRPEMLVNLSLAHERAGEDAAAAADLERLLADHPDTPYRPQAEQRMTDLQQRLAAAATRVPESSAEASTAGQDTLARDAAPRGSSWPPSWPTLAVGGGALMVAVVALATGLRAHRLYRDLEGRCPDAGCEPGFEGDRDRGRALARASTGLTFTAVALAGAAAGLWVHDVRVRRERVALGFGFGASSFRSRAPARASTHAEARFEARF